MTNSVRSARARSGAAALSTRRAGFPWVDLVVGAAVLVVLYLIVRVGAGTDVSFDPAHPLTVDTDPANLPYDAARSLLRMAVALAASTVFAIAYGYAAARSRRLERVLIPALDILQSVPVLGFLSITVTGFIALFPGSTLGLEAAAVFAIFTAMAWNMAFAFYQASRALPGELDELSRDLRFTRWMRLWRIEAPNAAIPLVWNGMMSMGGAWFFLTASEAISVVGEDQALPGVGSYAGAAVHDGDLGKIGWAILTMVVMIVAVNFLFWRPLTAWAERFKNEQAEAADAQRSFVLDLVRAAHWPRYLGRAGRALTERIGRAARVFGVDDRQLAPQAARRRAGDLVFGFAVAAALTVGLVSLLGYLHDRTGLGVFGEPLWLGLVTLTRVVALIVVATLLWVPVGVWIGLSPRRARIAQPVVQVLASFPANFLFPVALWVFVRTGVGIDVGGIALMALGAQWYILFNTIAGAMAVPTDLREAMDDLGVRGWQRWRRFLIPAVFPHYVTGGITASGGAWNASIVAEVVTFGGTTLTATGLGAYIAEATGNDDFPRVLAGVAVMSVYVVLLNRLVWRRLYRLATRRYALAA
ncbi:ABC transporter permease [Yinghuangia seranimata]|uniref:ABC transporter permease n=1 Tax=Yinghuangia seranimata TaxID=408067 RepID=UPI00248D158F|nr:ABC transporter permease subunit [Yinghuangia seranimata]MDI2126710.1 ABC transporter permease subunit [Yinghuangia seranimata]